MLGRWRVRPAAEADNTQAHTHTHTHIHTHTYTYPSEVIKRELLQQMLLGDEIGRRVGLAPIPALVELPVEVLLLFWAGLAAVVDCCWSCCWGRSYCRRRRRCCCCFCFCFCCLRLYQHLRLGLRSHLSGHLICKLHNGILLPLLHLCGAVR